jgi:hypothetical protein
MSDRAVQGTDKAAEDRARLQAKIIALLSDDDKPAATPSSAGTATQVGDVPRPAAIPPVNNNDGTTPDTPPAPGRRLTPEEADQELWQKSIDSLRTNVPADKNIGEDFFDDWVKRLGSNKVPYTGLNTDFTRQTGVNDASHKKTLKYSRLVDALNNKRFVKPGWAGVRGTFAANGGGVWANDAPNAGELYKMDGLETAESRAQQRAEEYEKEDTKRGIQRKQNVMDMPAAMERLKELAVLQQAGALTDDMRAEQRELYAAVLQNQYNLPYQMWSAEYQNTLAMAQARYNTMLTMLQQRFTMTLQEYIYRVMRIQVPMEQVELVLKTPDYLRAGMFGAAFQTGSPDLATRYVWDVLQSLGVKDITTMSADQIMTAIRRLQAEMGENGQQAADAEAQRQGRS